MPWTLLEMSLPNVDMMLLQVGTQCQFHVPKDQEAPHIMGHEASYGVPTWRGDVTLQPGAVGTEIRSPPPQTHDK